MLGEECRKSLVFIIKIVRVMQVFVRRLLFGIDLELHPFIIYICIFTIGSAKNPCGLEMVHIW